MDSYESTESVIEALNCAEEGRAKEELVKWVQECIAWFNDQNVGYLIQNQGSVVQEYRVLAHIQPNDSQRMVLLEDFYNSICNKIRKEFISGEVHLLEALEYALHAMDGRVFSGNHDSLNKLGDKLLAKLTPTNNDFSQGTYPSLRSMLNALHRVLVLIQQIAGSHWDPNLENGIHKNFKNRVKQIAESAKYYPIVYHTCLLEQALQRLELEGSQAGAHDKLRRACQGAKGIAHLFKATRALVVLDFDMQSLDEAGKSLNAALQKENIRKESWYDWLQSMNCVSLSCIEDAGEFELFQQGFDILMNKRANAFNKNQRKALFYTIVTQLCVLACNGCTPAVCNASMQKLATLADECKLSGGGIWTQDGSLVEVLLNSLVDVYLEGEEEVRGVAKVALEGLEEIIKKPAQEVSWYNRLTQDEAPAQKVMMEWLEGQNLEDKLSNTVKKAKSAPARIMFSTVNSTWKQKNVFDNSKSASIEMPNLQKALKEYYMQPYFSHVPSIFEGKKAKTLGSLQHQIILKGQDISIEDPIGLEDLFVTKSTKRGEPGHEIQKVLLTGKPGTGKTTLSHKLAHDWAEGIFGQMLEAVFVLRVRDLENLSKEEDISTAIASDCTLMANEDLLPLIRQELGKSTTLVVLDGLDERSEGSKRFISQAFLGKHKLLLLSRPHGIEQERSLVDREVQLVGLGEKQMQAYVHQNLSPNVEEELQAYLQRQPAVEAIAHIPLNLEILCTLWSDGSADVREEAMRGSLPGLYRGLTRYIWEHFARERGGIELKEHGEIFTLLGEVALRALERKQSKIGQGLVDSVLGERLDFRDKLKDSGFLLSVKGHYEFLHQTFQEYFAARVLAKRLQSNESSARRFVSKHKYEHQYRVMFSFLAGEASRNGVEGLEKLLSLVDEDPQEVVGVQHTCLQMRLLSEWLCTVEEQFGEEELESLEETFGIVETYNKWLSKGICQEKPIAKSAGGGMDLLTILLEEFEGFRIVAKYNTGLMNTLKDASKAAEASVRLVVLEALGGILKVAPDCGVQIVNTLINACKDSEWRVRRSAMGILGEVVRAAPNCGGTVVDALLDACRDLTDVVADTALKVLEKIVKVTPDYAIKVIDTLVTAPRNPELGVHPNALKAFGEAVQVVPKCAGKVVDSLVAACRDPECKARKTALIFLGEAVKVVPDFAVKIVDTAIVAYEDPAHHVREAALNLLQNIVEVNPDCAMKGMDTLLAACQDSEWGVCNAAMRVLTEVAMAVPDCVVRVMEALIHNCQDPERIAHTTALNVLGQVVRMGPECATKGVDAIIAACRDTKWTVRRNALNVLGEVIKVSPEYAMRAMDTLIATCMDPTWKVRDATLIVIREAVKAAPECSVQVVDPLVAACRDSEQVVRDAALRILGEVVIDDPDCMVKVADTLSTVCRDPELGDCGNTLKAFKVVLAVSADGAMKVVDTLIALCEDLDWEARRNVLGTLGEAVKVSPDCAENIVGILITACTDPKATIRYAALSVLGEIVRYAPNCALTIVDPLIVTCVDSDWRVCNAGMRALGEVVKVAPDCALKVMRALISACGDTERLVHTMALSIIGEVVRIAPDCVVEGVDILIAASGNPELGVCKNALNVLGEVVQFASDCAVRIMDVLMAACRNPEDSTRKTALSVLGNVIKVSPDYVVRSLDALLNACEDSEWGVCNTALRVLVEVVKVAPDCAMKVMDALVSACENHERVARTTILSTLGEIARIVPECTMKGVDTVLAACIDPKWTIRRSALENLKKIVKVSPECAVKAMDVLTAACRDLNWKVREAALNVIREAMSIAPECAVQAMDPLIIACGDTEWAVGDAALRVLGEAVKATPCCMVQVLEAIQNMVENASGVRRILTVLNGLPLQDIITSCWTTQNAALIELTKSKLYWTALTMEKKRNSSITHLVLYISVSDKIVWDKPHEEAMHFKQMIQSDTGS